MQPSGSSGGYGYYEKPGGGYAFYNPSGNSISAETYALGSGTDFATLINNMAKSGDTGAQQLIQQQGANLGKQETQNGVGSAFYWSGQGGADPYAQSILAGGGGAGSGATTGDPQAVSYYNDVIDQLQKSLQSAQGQQQTGVDNINNEYNKAVGRQNDAESTTMSNFAGQDVQNATDKENNLQGIANDTNNTYNSLMGLLGRAGAGVSSAAQYTAPQAISQNATTQRTGAFNNFGKNQQAIDTARTGAKQQYDNSISDLGTQRDQNVQSFLTNLLTNEGQLNQQIRDATINRAEAGGANYSAASAAAGGFKTAADNIQSQLDQIFKQYATPTFTPKAVTVTTPDMSKYTADPTKIQTQQSNPTTDGSLLPYLAQLKQNQTNNNLLTGGVPSAATAITAAA